MENLFKKLALYLAAVALPAAYSTNAAATVVCTGKIVNVSFETSYVLVNAGYGSWSLCNLAANVSVTTGPYGVQTISPEICKAYLSALLTAKAQQTDVAFYFGGTTCPTQRNINADYAYAIRFDD